jgi:hypothetical protein
MIQRRYGADFAVEALVETLIRNLDGHVPAGAWVVGAVYLAHSAFPDQRNDLVWAKFVASLQSHEVD